MTAMACSFSAIPRAVVSGGSVRFFPSVTNPAAPVTSYLWWFGDYRTFCGT